MSEQISVNPTPIQRNAFDVAMELTEIYKDFHGFKNLEDIQEVFTKFYATAVICNSTTLQNLLQYVPENLRAAYNNR